MSVSVGVSVTVDTATVGAGVTVAGGAVVGAGTAGVAVMTTGGNVPSITGVVVITIGGCTTITGKPGVAEAAGSGGAATTGNCVHGPVTVTTLAAIHPCINWF